MTAAQGDKDSTPARSVLAASERRNAELGHENLGSLSRARGFLSTEAPLLSLPESHRAWDELTAQLPTLHRELALRDALRAMPPMATDPERLPDRYLLRAASMLGILAHAHHHLVPGHPDDPPAEVLRAWTEVSNRLGRPSAVLTYIDVIAYNWRYLDPEAGGAVTVERADLAIPTVGSETERIFYLAQVELLDRTAPLIEAVALAQEAVRDDDVEALKELLADLTLLIRRVTNETFQKVDPNPASRTFVDPVLWAKTVASLAVPIREGVIGPSGASAPVVHVLDAFFGRKVYDSTVGHESLENRHVFPQHWRDFIVAAGAVSVREFVERRGDHVLEGLFHAAADAFCGDYGFLGRHRLKVYGFLDLAFKVGRQRTNSGFEGLYKDRAWDMVDDELEVARQERTVGFPPTCHHARVKSVTVRNHDERGWIKHIVLDVSDTGIRYEPGDRVGVLPENSEEQVARALTALRATGDEPIQVNAEWRQLLILRDLWGDGETIPLRDLLRFGRIRPVARPVAKRLHKLSRNPTLHRIIEARAEDQWELWDMLEMLATGGFDARRLWKAGPGEREYICRYVRPLPFRMYSISSALRDIDAGSSDAAELHLTVGSLAYDTPETPVSRAARREGTASSFLGRLADAEPGQQLSLQLIHPPRFNLPSEPGRTLVMFAAGTGLAPFRGFLEEHRDRVEPDWLFFATRTRDSIFHREFLEEKMAAGALEARFALSRDDTSVRFDPESGRLAFDPGARHRIGVEIEREDNARALWDLLRDVEDGGKGAYFYVCGQTGFALSVMNSLKAIIRRFCEQETEGPEAAQLARTYLQKMVAEERYSQEIFTTYAGPQISKTTFYNASDVVMHNNADAGYWMIVSGRVYDVSEFAELHPGGAKIIASYAGMDATQAYEKVLHHENAEVDAMLGMYEIGAVRRLDFGSAGGVTLGDKGLMFVALANVYRYWARLLYQVVEMENALLNDLSMRHEVTTRGEQATAATPLKAAFAAQTHARFMHSYLEQLFGEGFGKLWALTAGLCSRDAKVYWGARQAEALHQSTAGAFARGLHERLNTRLEALLKDRAETPRADEDARFTALLETCDEISREDLRFLDDVKLAVREVVKVFERHEERVFKDASDELLDTLRALPAVLSGYQSRILSRFGPALADAG